MKKSEKSLQRVIVMLALAVAVLLLGCKGGSNGSDGDEVNTDTNISDPTVRLFAWDQFSKGVIKLEPISAEEPTVTFRYVPGGTVIPNPYLNEKAEIIDFIDKGNGAVNLQTVPTVNMSKKIGIDHVYQATGISEGDFIDPDENIATIINDQAFQYELVNYLCKADGSNPPKKKCTDEEKAKANKNYGFNTLHYIPESEKIKIWNAIQENYFKNSADLQTLGYNEIFRNMIFNKDGDLQN